MAGIGVILNPYSKSYKEDPLKAKRMGFIVGDKGSCQATESLEDLTRVAEEFKKRQIEILGISGGDGTIHCTLTTFIKIYGDTPLPKIAFLRGGTLNAIASSQGTHGSSEKVLSNLVVKYHNDIPFETRTATLTRINNDYGFIFGMGVIYRFMEIYYQNSHLNPLIAGVTLARVIGSALLNRPTACRLFEKFEAEVTVNGKEWPLKEYSALFSGSINQIGLNFKVFNTVDRHPGHFHAAGLGAIEPRSILRHVPRMYLGLPTQFSSMLEAPAKDMTIQLKTPLAYTIDGDMMPACDRFELSAGPQITVLVK